MAFMNNNSTQSSKSGVGYLIVRVSTALGAIPLEDALVTIRGAEAANSNVIYSQLTDSSGVTKKVSLSAPDIRESESPGYPHPYSLYNIDVTRDGYLPLSISNVAVFDSITSIQPAVMIPLTDNKYSDSYSPGEDISPSDAQGAFGGGVG